MNLLSVFHKKPKIQPLAYNIELTRVMKGMIAPKGKIYFVIHVTSKGKRVFAYHLIESTKITDKTRPIIADALLDKLKEKYKI